MKAIKYQVRGAVYGSILTLAIGAYFISPYTDFRIIVPQETKQQKVASAVATQATTIGDVMPEFEKAITPVKTKADPTPARKPEVR